MVSLFYGRGQPHADQQRAERGQGARGCPRTCWSCSSGWTGSPYLHGVQKVDVVGDTCIAATNFTENQPDEHAARIARFAIDRDAVAAAHKRREGRARRRRRAKVTSP